MRRVAANKFAQALLVVLVLAAVYALAGRNHPVALAAGSQPAPPARIPVTAAVRACAAPGGQDGMGVAVYGGSSGSAAYGTAASGTAGSGTSTAGRAVLSRLSAAGGTAGPVLHTFTDPGRMTRVAVPLAAAKSGHPASPASSSVPTVTSLGGVTVAATGPMARGLQAEQTDPTGLATAACPAPGTDFWFAAPGQRSVAGLSLYLMNTDGQAADVAVDIFTDSGPVLGSADTGISVPAHGLLVQSLLKTVRGSRVVGLHVRTSTGRVVAMLRETRQANQPGGWIPASHAPSRTVIIPGLPAQGGSRLLYLLVPGTNGAQVKVTAITPHGTYQPAGTTGVNVAGASSGTVPLNSVDKLPTAIKVTSSQPIVAAVAATGGPPGAPGAFAAAAGPVHEQGVAADNISGPSNDGTLVLSAPDTAVQVRVTELAAGRQVGSKTVSVAAKHTAVMALGKPAGVKDGAPFTVVVTPLAGSGPLYAGRAVLVHGSVLSLLPITPALTAIPLPPVHDLLSAAQP